MSDVFEGVLLGKRIRSARVDQGLSIAEVAKKAGVLEATYRKIETGEFEGSNELVREVLEILGLRELWDAKPTHDYHDENIENPFVGLASYTEATSHLFFGRAELTAEVFEKLMSNKLVALTGPSGSGKSSLVQAGLAPLWKQKNDRRYVYMRPAPDPLAALASAVFNLTQPAQAPTDFSFVTGLAEAFDANTPERSAALIQQALQRSGACMLFIDQLEEIWSIAYKENCKRFFDILALLIQQRSAELFVVVAIRSDALGILSKEQKIFDVLLPNLAGMRPFTRQEIEKTITGPALSVGVELPQQLVETWSEFLAQDQNALPLLQFALRRTWPSLSDSPDPDTVERLGDVSALLEEHLEDAIANSGADLTTMRTVCLALVDQSTVLSKRPRRRRASVNEFSSDQENKLIEWLINARLIVPSVEEESHDRTFEFVHEAILTSWPRLRNWCAEVEAIGEATSQLLESFEMFVRMNKDEKFFADERLCYQLDAHRENLGLPQRVGDFLDASLNQHRSKAVDRLLGGLEVAFDGDGEQLPSSLNLVLGAIGQDGLVGLLSRMNENPSSKQSQSKIDVVQMLFGTTTSTIAQSLAAVDYPWLVRALKVKVTQDSGASIAKHIKPEQDPNLSLKLIVVAPKTASIRDEDAIQLVEVIAELDGLSRIELLERLRPVWQPLVAILRQLWEVDVLSAVQKESGIFIVKYCASEDPTCLVSSLFFPETSSSLDLLSKRHLSYSQGVMLDVLEAEVNERVVRTSVHAARLAFTCFLYRDFRSFFFLMRNNKQEEMLAELIHLADRYSLPDEDYVEALALCEEDYEAAAIIAIIGLGSSAKKVLLRDIIESLGKGDFSPHVLSTLEWYGRSVLELQLSEIIEETKDLSDPNKSRDISLDYELYRIVKIPGQQVETGPQSATDYKIYMDADTSFGSKITEFWAFDRLISRLTYKAFLEHNPKIPSVDIAHVSPDDLCPIVSLTWHEANEFCDWLTQKLVAERAIPPEAVVRLPTECEWEALARAGSSSAYFFGSDPERLELYAWYSKNAGPNTHPAAQKLPNAYGLFDTLGNCWEWCGDWYGSYPTASLLGRYDGPETGETKVLRGGCWNLEAMWCRCATRNAHAPENRNYYSSLRPVVVMEGKLGNV